MPKFSKSLWRVATSIHAQRVRHAPGRVRSSLPESEWRQLAASIRLCDQASLRSFKHARPRLIERMTNEVGALQRRLVELEAELRSRSAGQEVSAVGCIYADLVALEDEFEDLEVDFDERALSVTTQPITLEHLELGPFQIRLHWANIAERYAPYEVIALEPAPASANHSVTHPHVQDRVLCPGEGRSAIDAALSSGRLLDFFTLVERVLATYARGSAYVEISDWHGSPCDACGATVDENDRSYCERCGDLLCEDCTQSCADCGRSSCGGCLFSCAVCQQACCESCLQTCRNCNAKVCDDCRIDEFCESCHEATHEESLTDEPIPQTDDASATVQPHGLGQTALPA